MKRKQLSWLMLVLVLCNSGTYGANCPSMDATGDCRVDLADFAVLAGQWMTAGSYTLQVDSAGTVGVSIGSATGHGGATRYTRDITVGTPVCLTAPAAVGDVTFAGWSGAVVSGNETISFVMDSDKQVTARYVLATTTIIWVDIDDPGLPSLGGFKGQMSKYEITNAQYCQFLNSAQAAGLITVYDDRVYAATDSGYTRPWINIYQAPYNPNSQITLTNGVFTARNYDGYSMDPHPVAMVSWYGAQAFCDYCGYRLPTEWEWQAVADYDGSYVYGCGTTINNSMANYSGSVHPYNTTMVGAFGAYGYGMCDMAGNVMEWTASGQPGSYFVRDGGFNSGDINCTVTHRHIMPPGMADSNVGFRVCR